jgi:cobalt-precorrin-6B (C15)-methyltransferase
MIWIKDEEFLRGKIPMTKFEIRVLTLAMLGIGPGDIFLDVGAGTGSISVQAALLGAEVYAIERELEGVELIQDNAAKFGVQVHVVHDSAPEAIEQIPRFHKCFIGGSGGRLRNIVESVNTCLHPGDRLVANFIRPKNMIELQDLLKMFEYTDIETRLIQTAMADKLDLLRGQNPVFIVKGEKT